MMSGIKLIGSIAYYVVNFLVFKISFYIGLIFVYWTGSVYICVLVALVYCLSTVSLALFKMK